MYHSLYYYSFIHLAGRNFPVHFHIAHSRTERKSCMFVFGVVTRPTQAKRKVANKIDSRMLELIKYENKLPSNFFQWEKQWQNASGRLFFGVQYVVSCVHKIVVPTRKTNSLCAENYLNWCFLLQFSRRTHENTKRKFWGGRVAINANVAFTPCMRYVVERNELHADFKVLQIIMQTQIEKHFKWKNKKRAEKYVCERVEWKTRLSSKVFLILLFMANNFHGKY